jgi:hypothetical protein
MCGNGPSAVDPRIVQLPFELGTKPGHEVGCYPPIGLCAMPSSRVAAGFAGSVPAASTIPRARGGGCYLAKGLLLREGWRYQCHALSSAPLAAIYPAVARLSCRCHVSMTHLNAWVLRAAVAPNAAAQEYLGGQAPRSSIIILGRRRERVHSPRGASKTSCHPVSKNTGFVI